MAQTGAARLLAVYVVTSILAVVIANNAAVALIDPIARATASALRVEFMPLVIAIKMAGSASFATPLGYQTNQWSTGPAGTPSRTSSGSGSR